ncbi:MAG: hypothetical protein OEV74_07710 [Cyclobacteriaceae bacterium]|nr:hypothetical protein [Cyclobacteriaceae bacterium]MDH4296145.1 hypothetical protein [Cyclobacteriaceae bacterium]MDH5248346.1 hypothetical protein [Cyclobacteriaceae bacterium]
MKYLSLFLILIFVPGLLLAQQNDVSKLFLVETPLDIKLHIGVKDVKGEKIDTVYTSSMLYYKSDNNSAWDSIQIDLRARGEYRRRECYYPPLRIKMKKKNTKGTVFEGNKSLKLVMPCKQVKDNSLILREYLCYQMFEPITKYTFNTRLVNIDFTDDNSKKVKNVQIVGYFIEDDDLVAKRWNGKVMENLNLHPKALEDSNALRHDMFQYMVANTDWSTTFLHNAKLIQLNDTKKYIPLTYDFDMSGFVDAPYAVVDASLGIGSVRERLYRGFCRSDDVTQAIRSEFIHKEPEIMGAIKAYESSFSPKEYSGIIKYMEDFFETFKSDAGFKKEIIDKCRTK